MGRIIITGTNKGCGKTTVATAVLMAMQNRGFDVTGFKCGPDYSAPKYISEILGINAYNIDSFMMSGNTIRHLINEHGSELSVIDGALGYYDGYMFTEKASTCEISLITKTPSVLVVDCSAMEVPAAAVLYGYTKYSKNTIAGVIFNRLSTAKFAGAKRVCESLKLRCLGYLPEFDTKEIDNKNLPLMTAASLSNIKKRIADLAEIAEKTVDIDAVIEIAEAAKEIKSRPINIPYVGAATIAVANDRAFSLKYTDNIKMLKDMGAKIVEFSPLADKELPDNIDGILISGGYVEMYAEDLAKNTTMLESIRKAVSSGIPTIAESCGFVYLHESVSDITGMQHSMAGVIPGICTRVPPYNNYGYVELTADSDNLLLKKGETIGTYEFHRYESSNPGSSLIVKKNGEQWKRIHANEHLYAGFPHLNFYSDVRMAERFMRACIK